MLDIKDYRKVLSIIRDDKPLIHSITNIVVANITANFALALGASPIMASYVGEIREIVTMADVLLLNIGTITKEQFESMKVAAKTAKLNHKRVVLDPVGVGVSKFRSYVTQYFLEEGLIDIVKGNYSEILKIAGERIQQRGVDSCEHERSRVEEALAYISRKHNIVVAATGDIDFITDGENYEKLVGGNILLTKITGSGCMAAMSVAIFLSRCQPFKSAVYGLYTIKTVSSRIDADGPTEFYTKFIDSIYNL
ncbi:MAG: hydroxyethylthiazole kinase [Deferribacterota bacterium]|nr:hydroxyethylthiazole kinase [Deferribacterota bacterium]